MSRSTKRPRIAAGDANGDDGACNVSRNCIEAVAEPADNDVLDDNISCMDSLDDMLANILSYLKLREIMCMRCVSRTWTEAVMKTAVSPEEEFVVRSVKTFNAMRVMSTVLPNLQSVRLNNLQDEHSRHKYSDGEDPDEEHAARTANDNTHDLEIISNFRKLRRLEIDYAPLNGRYPFLFNFPLIQKLSITSERIKWDMEI